MTSDADASLPEVTFDITSPLTPSALPEDPNLSASSRFLGAALAIACFTAAMNAALSKPFGFAAAMVPSRAAFAWLALSSDGASPRLAPC